MTRRRRVARVWQDQAFKGRQFTAEVILWAVRWYLMFRISYRDLALMLLDRGVEVDHTTLFRWIQAYAAELEKRIRPHLRLSNGSWRVDETYVKVKGHWPYLYRAVDSHGQTIDFLLSAKRDAGAAKRFFRKAVAQPHTVNPRTITVDKTAAYPKAVTEMKKDGELWRRSQLRQVKHLNNIVEQDHRNVKRLIGPGLGFGGFWTARRTLAGYEAMAMIRKAVATSGPRRSSSPCYLKSPRERRVDPSFRSSATNAKRCNKTAFWAENATRYPCRMAWRGRPGRVARPDDNARSRPAMRAIASPPRSSVTPSGFISASRSAYATLMRSSPPAASSSAMKPCGSGASSSARINLPRAAKFQAVVAAGLAA